MIWGFSDLNLFPLLFHHLLLTFPILSIQVRSSDSIASTGPHHIRKNCKQEKKNTKMKPDLALHVSTPRSQAWYRTDQVKISSPLLLINTQTATLNMEIHMKRFMWVHKPQTTVESYVSSTTTSSSAGQHQ